MSISAVTSFWSWPNGTDPTTATNGQTATSAFEASLSQWQDNAGTQTATASQTDPNQQGTSVQHHHHHHHSMDMDDGQQNSGNTIQSGLSSLVSDIAGALQTGGSAGTTALQSDANALVADIAQTQANGTTAASASGATTAGSIQTAANALAADIAQALQAYGANPPTGSTIVSL